MDRSPLHPRTAGAPGIRSAWIASLTVLSALFLAWSGYKTLGPAFAARLGGPSTFTLRVPPAEPGSPSPSHHDVTITTIVVDGRRLRWNEVVREGTWLEREGVVAPLTHPGDQPTAAITFRGTYAVCSALPSVSGKILLERDGKPLKEVRLSDASLPTWQWEFVFEFESVEPPGWTFCVFLVVAIGAAGLLRPWTSGRTGDAWIFLHAAALHLLVWATQPVGTTRDTWAYVTEVATFLAGYPSYFPPGTSIFVAFCELIPWGPLGLKVTLVQHALIAVSVLWLYRLVRMSLTEEVAFVTGLVLGSSGFLLFLPQQVISEPLTCFAMTGAVYYAARYRDRGGLLSAIAAGVLAGWAGLARIVPLLGSIGAFACLHLLPLSRRGLRRFALVTAVSVAVMAAPVGWLWLKSGEPRLTTSEGYHMFNRVVKAQKKLATRGPMTERLLEKIDFQDPRGRDVWKIHEHLTMTGHDLPQINEILMGVSMEAVFDAPGEYVLFTLEQGLQQYLASAWHNLSWCGDSEALLPEVECPPVAVFTVSGLEWGARLMDLQEAGWRRLRWLALTGTVLLFFLRQWVYPFALSWLVFLHILGTSAGSFALARYTGPVVPFVIALAAVPLDLLVRSVVSLARRA